MLFCKYETEGTHRIPRFSGSYFITLAAFTMLWAYNACVCLVMIFSCSFIRFTNYRHETNKMNQSCWHISDSFCHCSNPVTIWKWWEFFFSVLLVDKVLNLMDINVYRSMFLLISGLFIYFLPLGCFFCSQYLLCAHHC